MTEKQSRPPDTEYQWRYLNGRHRLTRHLVPTPTLRRPAVCGITPAWHTPDQQAWLGAHSAEQYEKLKTLPPCKNCARKDPRTP